MSQLHEEETNVLTRMTGPDQEEGGGDEQGIKEEEKKRKQHKTDRDFTEGRCRTGKVGKCKIWNVKQEEGLTKKKGEEQKQGHKEGDEEERHTCKIDAGHGNVPFGAKSLQWNAFQHFCLLLLLKPSQFVKPYRHNYASGVSCMLLANSPHVCNELQACSLENLNLSTYGM